MCDKGCAACSVFLFCTNCSTSHLTLTPGVHCLSSSSFLPACPPCLSQFFSRPPSPCTLPTPALALAHGPPRRDRFDTSSINPSLDEFFFVFCVVGASWAPIAPGDPEPTVLSRSANERNNRDLFPRHRISIHPRIQIHLEWPWCLRRCEKKTISGIGKFHELHQALAPRLFLSLDLHLDPTRNRRPHPRPAMISSQVARRWATIAIATLLLSSMVVAEPSIPTNYCSPINTADMEPCTPPSPRNAAKAILTPPQSSATSNPKAAASATAPTLALPWPSCSGRAAGAPISSPARRTRNLSRAAKTPVPDIPTTTAEQGAPAAAALATCSSRSRRAQHRQAPPTPKPLP